MCTTYQFSGMCPQKRDNRHRGSLLESVANIWLHENSHGNNPKIKTRAPYNYVILPYVYYWYNRKLFCILCAFQNILNLALAVFVDGKYMNTSLGSSVSKQLNMYKVKNSVPFESSKNIPEYSSSALPGLGC